ncbi:MAG: hypothetical protein LW831_12565, partial [Phycisphaeraceae bacterium]|nr:hypothetical protein [Phycisphaeraceae bacterium]
QKARENAPHGSAREAFLIKNAPRESAREPFLIKNGPQDSAREAQMGESASVWGIGTVRAGAKMPLNWPRIRRGRGG